MNEITRKRAEVEELGNAVIFEVQGNDGEWETYFRVFSPAEAKLLLEARMIPDFGRDRCRIWAVPTHGELASILDEHTV
ncbi:MAG: hypothetical protein ABIJ95_11930 [Pseudomonadota bacterium]